MKKFIIILLLCVAPFLQGCAVFVASQLGYYEAKSKYSKPYNDYRLETELTNAERAAIGLPAQPLKEFGEWIKGQPLTSNEIKVFKMRGVISAEDAQEIKEREAMDQAG
ncbi:MAG: hypothetical protein QME65_04645 [Candidatus Omnitrophota bacterium]|nr:hypothetical protein [Candidatus Omnitrophota bacterium]